METFHIKSLGFVLHTSQAVPGAMGTTMTPVELHLRNMASYSIEIQKNNLYKWGIH